MARNNRRDEELDRLVSSSLGAEKEKPQKKSALDQIIEDSLGEGYQERQTTAHRDLIGGTERPAAVRNWVQQYINLMPKVGRVQEANGGRYTEDIFGGYRDDIDRLIAQYEQIRPYAKDYGLSPSAYSGLRRLVSDMDSRSQLMQEMGESGYNAAMWRQKYQGQSLEDINKAIASAGTKADERAWLQNFKDFDSGLHQSMTEEERSAAMEQHRTELESMTAERDKLRQQVIGYSRAIGMKKQQEEAEERIKELEKQISETKGKLQTMDWDNNLANRNARAAEWEKVDTEADFDRLAAAGAEIENPDIMEVVNAYQTGNFSEAAPRAINKVEYYFANNSDDLDSHWASNDTTIMTGRNHSWDLMTEQERKRYSYLLQAKGETEADQYLKDMEIVWDRRRTKQEQQTRLTNWQDDNVFEKAGKNLRSIPMNVIGGGLAAAGDLISAAEGKFNPYSRAHTVTDTAQQIRSMTSEDIVKQLKDYDPMWGKIVSNTYQGVMSGFDSALGATLMGQGYTAMMAAGAASSRAKELYEAGANDWQIAVGAVASGAIEAAFEYISVDKFAENFLKGNIKNFGDWALKTLLQGGIEASEEVNTELGNMIANALILGANSDNQREIRKLMMNGMTREEAERQAVMNRCVDVFWAAYGGFVSGGGMGGFGGAVNGIRANQYYGAAGSNIIQNEESGSVIQAAKDAGVNAKLLALAESKAQATIDNWNEASGRQQRAAARTMGRLYEATTNAQAEAAATAEKRTFRDRVTEILQKKGTKNAAEAAEVITKATYEGSLNSSESEIYEAAKGNEVASEVQNSREFREAAKAATQTAQETYRKTAVAAADMYSPVNPRTLRENKKTVESMADAYAEPQVMIDTYQDGQNPYQYEYAYQRAYEMGREGIGIEYAMSAAGTQYLKQNQIQAAYESGRKAGGYGTESNGVRQGQKWNDRQNPRRPAQGMEAGAAESRPQAEGSTAEKAAGRVSTRDLGIADGTDNKNLQIRQEKDYTDADRKAQETAKKHGLKLVVVQGDSIQVTETAKDGSKYMVKARALVSGDTVIVRGDDPMFDSGMIAGHEVTHKEIERGEISIDDVRQELRSRYTDAEINDIIDLYAAAYGNTGMTADEILEEIICDAQGEMNAFATDVTKAVAGEVGLFLRRTAAATARAGRGEAQQRTGAKASRETDEEYMKLAKDPEANEARLREMVEARAKEAGYTEKVYHGSEYYGFTKVDTEKSDDKISFFASGRTDTAKSYSGQQGVLRIGKKMPSAETLYAMSDEEFLKRYHEVDSGARLATKEEAEEFFRKKEEAIEKGRARIREWDYPGHEDTVKDLQNAVKEMISASTESEAVTAKIKVSLFAVRLQNTVKEESRDWWNLQQLKTAAREKAELMPHRKEALIASTYNGELYLEPKFSAAEFLAGQQAGYHLDAEGEPIEGEAGNYELMANTDGMLVVDANGENWNHISAEVMGESGYTNTRKLARWAYDNGYSGVIYKNLVDIGRYGSDDYEQDTIYNFFYPDMQVKSADPVVYDDNGEVIPLDKRFDWENDDIRYSREMEGLQAQEEITEELKALMQQLTEQNENLKEENADLNKKLASAKRASTITERKTAQRADVRRVARSILQNESSTLSIDDVEGGFQRIADSIVAGETGPGVFGQLVQEAQRLADMIVDSTEVNVNDYVEDTYRELKRYLRKTPIKITEEMMLDIPDFKDFKSRNRYNFRLKENGTDIDVLWSEMAGLFGNNFFPEDIQNPVDMLMHLEDVIGKIAPNVQNPYRSVSDAEIRAKQLTNTILMELMSDRIKANPSTKIDRAIESRVKKIQEQLDEMGRAQAQQREQRKQTDVRNKILRINDSLQRMATKGGKAATQHAPESLIKSVREFSSVITESLLAAENRKKEGYYERADKLAAEMGKGFKVSQVEEYRRIEDQSKRNERAILRLQSVLAEYQAMKSNDEYAITYDATVDEMLQGLMRDLRGTLNQGDLYELNSKQLIGVARTLQALMHTVQNANMAFSMGENKRISDMANKWAGEIKQVKWTGPGMKSMAQRFMMWQMSPDVFFNYLSGYAKNNEGQVIQKAFAQGTERMLAVQREFYETFKGFTESSDKAVRKELGQLLNPKGIKGMNANQIIRGEKIGLVDMNGNSVNITRGMAMQLLMLLDQKDSLRSIALGGLSLPNLETYYKGETQAAYGNGDDYALITRNIGESYTELLQQLKELDQQRDNPPEGIDEWTEEAYAKWQQDIDQKKEDVLKEMGDLIKGQEEIALGIRDKLAAEMTDLEKQLIKAAHSWYGRTGEMMADVFVRLYGYRPALVDNYVPIHRDMASLKVDIRDMAGAEKAFNLENSGFTIERVKSISPILLTDFFGELDQQKAKMARYVGFAQIQKDFNKIWKYQVGSNGMTINRLIRNRFGSGDTTFGVSGEDYIEHYVADVAGGHTEGGIFNAFYGSYAAATLRFNPRVAVSQAASIPTAASVVGWKAAAKGFARGLPKAASTDYKNQLAAKNEWFYQRYRGEGGSTELSDIKRKGGIFERVANSDVGKKLFNWCQNFDVLSTGSIMWSMAEESVKAEGITPSMDGYEDAVNQRYTDIIRKSQPNYTTTERADMLRDQRNGMKILTMFKTQSSQNLNLLLDANLEFIKMRQDLKNGANGVTKADLDAAKTKMANAYTGVFLGGTVGFVLIRTLMNFLMAAVNPYRDKETNEVTAAATAAGIGKEMLSSVAGMVALGGPAYDFFSSVISGDKYYGLSDSAISALSGTLENTAKVLQAALDSDKEITGDMLYKLMNSLAQTQGIPVGNAKKLADMMATYIRDIRGGTFGQYTSDKTTLKQYEAQVVKHYIEGDTDKVDNALAMLWAKSTKEGDEAIRKDVIGKIKGYLKGAYTAADITDLDVERILEYIGADDPAGILAKWDFEMEYPDIESPSDSMVAKYNQRGSIPADVFLEAYEYEKTLTADKDKNGKTINGSKKAKLVAYIVSLKLPKAQAKQLFLLLNGGSLQGTPWE